MLEQSIVTVGRIPYAEFSCHTGVHLAFGEVFPRLFPLFFLQAVIKISSCCSVYVKQSLFCLLRCNDLCGFFRFRQSDVGPLRQFFHSFREIQILHFHQKGEHIACRTAAKAVIKLFFAVYGKGSRFFIVEGTQPKIGTALLLQGHILGNDFYDIVLHSDFVNDFSRISHDHSLPSIRFRKFFLSNRKGSCFTSFYFIYSTFLLKILLSYMHFVSMNKNFSKNP